MGPAGLSAGLARACVPGGPLAVLAGVLCGGLEAERGRTGPVAAAFAAWEQAWELGNGAEPPCAAELAVATARAWGLARVPSPRALLFALHSACALPLRLLALQVARGERALPARGGSALRARLGALEGGSLLRAAGVEGLLEGDPFGWYLAAWTPALAEAIGGLAPLLDALAPAPDPQRLLYEALVPGPLRRALGEFYTPGWLAEHLVALAGFRGVPGERLLDPTCGGGAVLAPALRRALA